MIFPKNDFEPSTLLKRKEHINANKISFEVNEIKLPTGIEKTFGSICHPGAALAVPLNSRNEVIILRQYRFAVSRRIIEFPAGTLEEGEEPLFSMKRELAEETGYNANRWDYLGGMLPCPGYSDEVIHMFLARDLSKLENPPKGDEDEDLEVLNVSSKELDDYIFSGKELLDGKTITAWYRAKQVLEI